MQRRVHYIALGGEPDNWYAGLFAQQLNAVMRPTERIVAVVKITESTFYVIADDLGLGPR